MKSLLKLRSTSWKVLKSALLTMIDDLKSPLELHKFIDDLHVV